MARFEAFWDVVCDYRDFVWIGFMVCLFFLVLTLFSLFFGTPGTASYLISLLNLAMILVLGTVLGGMFWVCQKRQTKEYVDTRES